MAKGANLIGTVTITISTTAKIESYLERLVMTGEYGKNTAEAAERVIVYGLRGLAKDGELKRDDPQKPTGE